MKEEKEIYAIALTLLKPVSAELVKRFAELGYDLEDFFEMDKRELRDVLGLGNIISLEKDRRDEALDIARKHWDNMKRKKVRCLILTEEEYPVRLYNIPDPPIVLYIAGEADLDAANAVSVVGTRRPTSYGLNFCNTLIEELVAYFPNLSVISGLAYGIDAAAHKAALSNKCQTVAVVAHGLDIIYPAPHRDLASNIIRNGGAIVSEYLFGEKPYKQRFLERNRIVAALADTTVVVESDIKGGAMSTANTAFNYSREVMALPGRISDQLSAGCNYLIKKEKARILTSAADLIEASGWKIPEVMNLPTQKSLFPELSGSAKIIYDLLRFHSEPMQIDQIFLHTHIPMAELMSELNDLEFEGIISRLPGNRYVIG